MSAEEIPYADAYLQTEEHSDEVISVYDQQKRDCLKEMKKICKDRASVSVVFYALPETRLVEELETRGFVVKYKVNYDQEKPNRYMCRMKIINPKFLNSTSSDDLINSLEENLKSFGFTTNCEGDNDALRGLLRGFLS